MSVSTGNVEAFFWVVVGVSLIGWAYTKYENDKRENEPGGWKHDLQEDAGLNSEQYKEKYMNRREKELGPIKPKLLCSKCGEKGGLRKSMKTTGGEEFYCELCDSRWYESMYKN